jgi:type VI secretion system protein ImpA
MDWLLLKELQLPCEGLNPAGQNLEYEEPFLEMMRHSEAQPEIQYGATVLPARQPEWNRLLEVCMTVSAKTRDLRVGTLMVECLARTNGWQGLAAGLELIAAWTENFWGQLYPELDSDEGDDPTARLSCLSRLVDEEQLIRCIQDIPMVTHRTLGSLSLRDYLHIYFPAGKNTTTSLTPVEVEVIFQDSERALLAETHDAVQLCLETGRKLNELLIQRVGTTRWSAMKLLDTVSRVEQIVRTQLVKHAPSPVSTLVEASEPAMTTTPNVQESVCEPEAIVDSRPETNIHNDTQITQSVSAIHSRAEASLAIDYICAYFEANEPASPVPLLLQRAKRLIPMSFVEILRELAPNEGQQLLQHLISAERLER